MLVNKNFLVAFLTTLQLLVEGSVVKRNEDKPDELAETRLKRESIFAAPLYYDTTPYQAVQPAPAALPTTQPAQQQQSLPILGALISGVPGLNGITSTLTTLLPLGNLGNLAGLGGLGGLLGGPGGLGGLTNVGTLGNLGGLGNLLGLGNLGGPLTGSSPRCPLTQTLNCRCENLLPPPVPTPPTTRSSDGLQIIQQNIKFNFNGDKEISARLSNGLLFHQRFGSDKLANNKSSQVVQGFYTFRIKDNKYFTIRYTINDLDYTVKADVAAEPPQNDLDELAALY